jgi:hypothetical protein
MSALPLLRELTDATERLQRLEGCLGGGSSAWCGTPSAGELRDELAATEADLVRIAPRLDAALPRRERKAHAENVAALIHRARAARASVPEAGTEAAQGQGHRDPPPQYGPGRLPLPPGPDRPDRGRRDVVRGAELAAERSAAAATARSLTRMLTTAAIWEVRYRAGQGG